MAKNPFQGKKAPPFGKGKSEERTESKSERAREKKNPFAEKREGAHKGGAKMASPFGTSKRK